MLISFTDNTNSEQRKTLALRTITLIILLSAAVSLRASNSIFHSYKVKDGLSHAACTSVLKDKEGYIWIGTYNGLNRFDGYEFTVFKNTPNDSTSLSNNAVEELFLDRQGNLWVATHQGLNKYDYLTGRFKRYFQQTDGSNSFVKSICQDSKGLIYCGVWGGGIYIINPGTDDIKHFELSAFNGLSRRSDLVQKVICDTNDNIWVCTWGEGLIRIDAQSREIQQIKAPDNEPGYNNYVWTILEHTAGHFYVSSAKGGFYTFNGNNRQLHIVSKAFTQKHTSIDINTMGLDHQGNIWIGTLGHGAFKYSPSLKTFNEYIYKKGKSNAISSNRISQIYLDKETNLLWLATLNGINYIDPWIEKFNLVGEDEFPVEAQGSECLSFAELNGELLIGTWGSGILRYDYIHETFTTASWKKPQLSDDQVYSLHLRKNKLFAGTKSGLNIIDLQNNNIEKFFPEYAETGKLGSNYIRDVFVDDRDSVWLGTDAGLEHFDFTTGKFRLFKPYPESKPEVLENLVWSITQDKDGDLFVGTEGGGLCRFNLATGRFEQPFKARSGSVHDLPSNRVISTFRDSQNRLWFGTAAGLCLFNPNKRTFKTLTEEDGLDNDVVFAIQEDAKGNIWFSTSKTIVRLDPVKWNYVEFSYSDGVQQKEFYKDASIRLSDGQLVFGGLGGFNIFHPDSIKYNTSPPKVVITGIQVFNQDIYEFQKTKNTNIISHTINHVDKLKLNHKDNSVSIKFAALNYSHSHKNKYKYRLKNFDKQWIFNGTKRTAIYTNLPPGNYLFEVMATNNDGYWSTRARELNIRITPPIYKTLMFKLFTATFIILSTLLFFKIRTQQMKHQTEKLERLVSLKTKSLSEANQTLEEKQKEIQSQNKEIIRQRNELNEHKHHLEELVEIRTKDLEIAKNKAEESEKLKSAFLANISHEIRTPMNAIIGFSTLIGQSELSDDERKQFISYIRSNSDILLVLIDDLLDLSRIESGILKINKEKINLLETIQTLTEPYKLKIEAKGLEFRLQLPTHIQKLEILSDPVRIQQIIRNLLENAIKFTDQGFIELGMTLAARQRQKFIQIHIKDSGIGIPQQKQEVIFQAFKKLNQEQATRLYEGTGLGLTISKNLVRMLGGRIWVESKEGEYSTFIFTLPVDNDLLEEIF